jgi:hypothetical protein
LITVIEGQWAVQCNGRKTTICPGDRVWTNLPIEVTCSGRFNRWIYIVHSTNEKLVIPSSILKTEEGNVEDDSDAEDEEDVNDEDDSDAEDDEDLVEDDLDYGVDVDEVIIATVINSAVSDEDAVERTD